MADKVTNSNYLDFNMGFVDDDTRRFKVRNPISAVTTEQVAALDAAIASPTSDTTLSFFVGDKNGAAYSGVMTIDSIRATATDFDLT